MKKRCSGQKRENIFWNRRFFNRKTCRVGDKKCILPKRSIYDYADLKKEEILPIEGVEGKLFVSPTIRSRRTAKALFPGRETTERKELKEVPLRSFMDTKRSLSLRIWNVMGRIQWMLGSRRQEESRSGSIQRANAVIDLCEAQGEDCILVTHGCFIKLLLKTLKKRGYVLDGDDRVYVRNLQMITAVKN